MLAARAVTGIDDRHRRDLGRAVRSARLMVTNHDDVAIAANDADGILDLFGLALRGKSMRVFGGTHLAAQPVHGPFKAEAGPGGRLIEQAGQNSILIVQGPAAGHDSLHQPRPVEQLQIGRAHACPPRPSSVRSRSGSGWPADRTSWPEFDSDGPASRRAPRFSPSAATGRTTPSTIDRKSTRLNYSH